MEGKTIRLLVAIDGSEPAGVAVDLVADFAWPDGTEILVAEVVESGAGLFGEPWSALAMVQADSLEAEIRADADRTVDEARGRLVRPGLNVEAVVLRGRPATAIIDRARGMRADLIVIGSRGHGTIESMLLGSVSAEVIDHAPAPVLVATRSAASTRACRDRKAARRRQSSSGAAQPARMRCRWQSARRSRGRGHNYGIGHRGAGG